MTIEHLGFNKKSDEQEIADKVEDIINREDRLYKNKTEFYKEESDLIKQACKETGHPVPANTRLNIHLVGNIVRIIDLTFF